MTSKKSNKQKPKFKALEIPKLTKQDNNLILLKKNDECTSGNELLGPLGRSLSEESERKKTHLKSFMEEVEKIKDNNRRALITHRTFLSEIEFNYLDILENREKELAKYNESKRINVDEPNMKPVYLRRRVIRDLKLEKKMKFFQMVPNEWIVRSHILNKFIEAARRVLIHRRLIARLANLKSLTEDDLKFVESGGCLKNHKP